MRVKLGNKLYLCTKALLDENACKVTIFIDKEEFSILTNVSKQARDIFEDLFMKGFVDISNCCIF